MRGDESCSSGAPNCCHCRSRCRNVLVRGAGATSEQVPGWRHTGGTRLLLAHLSLKDLSTTSLLALWIRVDLTSQKFSFEEARREISDSGWSAAVLVKAPAASHEARYY